MIQIAHPGLPAPGRLFAGPRPDPPAAAVAALAAEGITTVACLLEPPEGHDLEAAYARAPLQVLRFPIPDFGVPADTAAFRAFLRDLLDRLRTGESVYMHCYGGRGRTGTALACLFILVGESPATAVKTVRARYRPEAVETSAQRRFVEAFR